LGLLRQTSAVPGPIRRIHHREPGRLGQSSGQHVNAIAPHHVRRIPGIGLAPVMRAMRSGSGDPPEELAALRRPQH
jgi:hypothetical protein